MSKIINGRVYHGAMYGDGSPQETITESCPAIQHHPNLIISYEVSKVNGKWLCDVQIHNNAVPADCTEAFKIIEESASKHAATPVPAVAETVTTDQPTV